MLHKTIIHVATNRSIKPGAQPDPMKPYPTSPKKDFFEHEPNKHLSGFARFYGTVSTGRQLTELELHFCKYPWFARNIMGLEPPTPWQPELLKTSGDYVESLSAYMKKQDLKMVASFRHGFDTTSLNGFMHALALSEGVHDLGVAVSEMSWSSHGKPLLTAYLADMDNMHASAPASEAQLELDILAAGGANKVIAVTHSLGAPLLLAGLLNRYNKALGKPEKLHSIFLVSPDIDTQKFINCYTEAILASAHFVYVLVSERDLPLRMSEAFREFGVDNKHSRLGQAYNPPVIDGITFVDDTKNDHGILGHMLRMRTIALILKDIIGAKKLSPRFINNPNVCEQVRAGKSPHYVVTRTHLW